ncbi:MAG: hypothetical protein Q8P67_00355, partial [archaeon]|nr:hypothetical protein [archaeon]
GAEAGEEAQRLQQLGWVASETVSLLLEDVRAFLDHSKELRPLHWYVCGHGAKWARDCMRARSELELEPPRPLPAPAGDLSVDTPVDGGVNYPASIGGFEAGSQSPSTPGYRQHSGSSGSSSSSESTTSSPEFFETYPRTGNAGGLSDSPAFQPSFSEFPSSGRPIPDSIIAFQQYNHPDQPHQPLHAAGDDIDSGYAQDISPSTATFGEASDYTPLPPSRTPSQFESIELVPSYPSLPEYPSGIPSHPLDFQAVSLHNPSFQTPQSPTASASLPYRSPPSPSHLSPAISPELLHITASPSAYRPSPGTPKIPIPSTPLVLGPMPNTPSESSETSPKTPKRSRPVDQTPSNVEGFSGPKRHHR